MMKKVAKQKKSVVAAGSMTDLKAALKPLQEADGPAIVGKYYRLSVVLEEIHDKYVDKAGKIDGVKWRQWRLDNGVYDVWYLRANRVRQMFVSQQDADGTKTGLNEVLAQWSAKFKKEPGVKKIGTKKVKSMFVAISEHMDVVISEIDRLAERAELSMTLGIEFYLSSEDQAMADAAFRVYDRLASHEARLTSIGAVLEGKKRKRNGKGKAA